MYPKHTHATKPCPSKGTQKQASALIPNSVVFELAHKVLKPSYEGLRDLTVLRQLRIRLDGVVDKGHRLYRKGLEARESLYAI